MRRMGLSCQRELYVCIVNNLGMRKFKICRADNKQNRKVFRPTLLSVGTIFYCADLQSVHGGENEYEPICYRRSD